MFFDYWRLDSSISHDPSIYIKEWSYPSRKHISNAFCKFPTSKHESEPSWIPTGLETAEKLT
jgi:hypothetical protein